MPTRPDFPNFVAAKYTVAATNVQWPNPELGGPIGTWLSANINGADPAWPGDTVFLNSVPPTHVDDDYFGAWFVSQIGGPGYTGNIQGFADQSTMHDVTGIDASGDQCYLHVRGTWHRWGGADATWRTFSIGDNDYTIECIPTADDFTIDVPITKAQALSFSGLNGYNPWGFYILNGAFQAPSVPGYYGLAIWQVGVTAPFTGGPWVPVLPEDPGVLVPGEIVVEILDPDVPVSPAAVTIIVNGGVANTDATVDIDGDNAITGTLDTNGHLGSTTIPFGALAAGVHTLTVTQLAVTGDTITGSAQFTIARAPIPFPTPPPAGVPAANVPSAVVPGTSVRRWVLQDPGGLGNYIFPFNPRTMTSPHYAKTLTSRRATAVDGQYHVSEAAGQPKQWQFAGYAPTEDMCDQLLAYRDLHRRFYLIDHRNRAWQVVFNHVQLEPRLRQRLSIGHAPGVLTDWGTNYTVLATILNQNWSTPA